jgi:hypothetical protein
MLMTVTLMRGGSTMRPDAVAHGVEALCGSGEVG